MILEQYIIFFASVTGQCA